jgi:hypothetical protein
MDIVNLKSQLETLGFVLHTYYKEIIDGKYKTTGLIYKCIHIDTFNEEDEYFYVLMKYDCKLYVIIDDDTKEFVNTSIEDLTNEFKKGLLSKYK